MSAYFQPNSLYDPGLHLFVDNTEVHQLWGVERQMFEPRKLPEPVIVSDQPWEIGRRVQAWGSVSHGTITAKYRFTVFAPGSLSQVVDSGTGKLSGRRITA